MWWRMAGTYDANNRLSPLDKMAAACRLAKILELVSDASGRVLIVEAAVVGAAAAAYVAVGAGGGALAAGVVVEEVEEAGAACNG